MSIGSLVPRAQITAFWLRTTPREVASLCLVPGLRTIHNAIDNTKPVL